MGFDFVFVSIQKCIDWNVVHELLLFVFSPLSLSFSLLPSVHHPMCNFLARQNTSESHSKQKYIHLNYGVARFLLFCSFFSVNVVYAHIFRCFENKNVVLSCGWMNELCDLAACAIV